MKAIHFILTKCLLLCVVGRSMAYQLSGKITNTANEPLSYANIYIKGTSNGTSANVEGIYTIELPEGIHEVVFQYIGYQQRTEFVTISGNKELNITLQVLQYQMNDLVVNAKEDPATQIIKQAIARRKYFLNAVESYSCDAYVKGIQRVTDLPFWAEKRLKKAGIYMGKDGVIYLSESVSKLYYKKPDKFHEVVKSSKVSGRSEGFTYNSAQDFFFNFYKSTIDIPGIAPRPLISPLNDNAFFYYNFKMLGAHHEGGLLINKIQVTPKRKADPCFNGFISIVDGNWNIHSLELFLTKVNGIEYLDTLKVTQYFLPVKDDLWLASQQRYDANLSMLGVKGNGYYLGIFKNYELNNLFGAKKDSVKPVPATPKAARQQKKEIAKTEKKIFTPEIIRIEQEANKRDSIYWDSIRPVPLTVLETNDYQIKDSIQTFKESKAFKDSTDKQLNKPGFMSILTGYTYRKQYKKIEFTFPSPFTIFNFNTVEGPNIDIKLRLRKRWDKNRAALSFEPVFRYGFTNRDWQLKATVSARINQQHDEHISISGGKYISQFNEAQPQSGFGNTAMSLIFKSNFMKLYQHYFARVTYTRELYNGIYLNTALLYSKRTPLENTNQYSFFPKYPGSYTSNGVDLPGLTNETNNITSHSVFRIDVRFKFVFGQQYITRPDFKIRTSSKYPQLSIAYKRAIPIKGFSNLNYDYLEAQLTGDIPMKLVGELHYRFGGGGFATAKAIQFTDYKHFFGNFLTTGETDMLGFYGLRYYRHSTNRYFAEAHLEHHFKGFFFNKIPGWRKLKLHETLGFHFLYTPTRQQYFQLDAGIENILKVLRADFVAGFGSQKNEYYFGARLGLLLNVSN